MAEPPAGPPFALKWPETATATTCVKLLDGREMPLFGLGVYKTPPGWQTENAVIWALEAGYRLIDTAALYKNELSVSEGMKKAGVPRGEVFLTTKLWDSDHGYDKAIAACERSLKKLGVEYIDLYLIHSPTTGKLVETWDALLELQCRGLVRSIGVSNFGVKHIEALEQHGRPLPVVNQIELHPMVWQERAVLLEFCKQKSIIVTAYGSLFAGQGQFLKDRTLMRIAAECDKTAGQVLLRWGHQMGLAIIPKSTQRSRIFENMQVFDFQLSAAHMEMLCRMRGNLGEYWNPLGSEVDVGDTSHGQKAAGGKTSASAAAQAEAQATGVKRPASAAAQAQAQAQAKMQAAQARAESKKSDTASQSSDDSSESSSDENA